MSKKDYQAIAGAFYGRKVPSGSVAYTVWVSLRDDLERLLASGNPRFDRARFIEACETGKCKGMKAQGVARG